MLRKIGFTVISASSHEDNFSPQELLVHAPNVSGWRSNRLCSYPQHITLQLEERSRVKKLQLLAHHFMIPSKVELHMGDGPDDSSPMRKLGYVSLFDNEQTSFKAQELKLVHLNAVGTYLRITLHQNHKNLYNRFNQVALVAVNVLGDPLDGNAPSTMPNCEQLIEQYLGGSQLDGALVATSAGESEAIPPLDDLAFTMYQDPAVAHIIRLLDQRQQEKVYQEKFDEANHLRQAIDNLQRVGKRLARLDMDKRCALKKKDYNEAEKKLQQMEQLRQAVCQHLEMHELLDPSLIRAAVSECSRCTPLPPDTHPVLAPPSVAPDSPRLARACHRQLPWLMPRRARGSHRQQPLPMPPRARGPNPQQSVPIDSPHMIPGPIDSPHRIPGPHPQQPGPIDSPHRIPEPHPQQPGPIDSPHRIPEPHPQQPGPIDSPHRIPGPHPQQPGPIDSPHRAQGPHPQPQDLSSGVPTPSSPSSTVNPQIVLKVPYDQRPLLTLVNPEEMEDKAEAGFRVTTGFRGEPEPLPERALGEAIDALQIFGDTIVSAVYSKNWSFREKALMAVQQGLLDASCTASKEEFRLMTRAAVFLVKKTLTDRVSSVFQSSLKLLLFLLSELIPRGRLGRGEVTYCLEQTWPHLLSRTGDPNSRLRPAALSFIQDMALLKNVQPLQWVPCELVKPFSATIPSRLAQSRAELVLELLPTLGTKSSGFTVQNVMTFCCAALEHNVSAVRSVAVQIILALYQQHSSAVLRCLPPNDHATRKSFIYKTIFDGFSKIDGTQAKTHDGDKGTKAQSSKKNPAKEEKEAPKTFREDVRKPPQSQPALAADVQETSGNYLDNQCIFCGRRDEAFTEDGLDLHYWKHCPMLHCCDLCKQVVEISSLTEHLLGECGSSAVFSQCPRCTEAVPSEGLDKHMEGAACHPRSAGSTSNHCPLCHCNFQPGDEAWKTHLMNHEGCKHNPRRPALVLSTQPPKAGDCGWSLRRAHVSRALLAASQRCLREMPRRLRCRKRKSSSRLRSSRKARPGQSRCVSSMDSQTCASRSGISCECEQWSVQRRCAASPQPPPDDKENQQEALCCGESMDCQDEGKILFLDDDSNQVLPVEQFFGNMDTVQDFPQRMSPPSTSVERAQRRRRYYAPDSCEDQTSQHPEDCSADVDCPMQRH